MLTTYKLQTCQAYIETLKMPLTHKQPKKWWTNRQTNKQTDKPNTLPLLRMRAQGVDLISYLLLVRRLKPMVYCDIRYMAFALPQFLALPVLFA